MQTAFIYQDFPCYQLQYKVSPTLKQPLQKLFDQLSNDTQEVLLSAKPLEAVSTHLLAQVFELRIKALKWLASQENFDYMQQLAAIVPTIEKLKTTPTLNVLSENLLFALRCHQRVMESIMQTTNLQPEAFGLLFAELPDQSYFDFLATLAIEISDDKEMQETVDWLNASLSIEWVMIAASIIHTKSLLIAEEILNDLAFLAADSAQNYFALAVNLGLVKTRTTTLIKTNFSFDNDSITEQKHLANLGLDDFAKFFSYQ
jgi:hypothetical protein